MSGRTASHRDERDAATLAARPARGWVHGCTARVAAVVGGWLWPGSRDVTDPGSLGIPFVLFGGGIALLVATGMRRRPVAAA